MANQTTKQVDDAIAVWRAGQSKRSLFASVCLAVAAFDIVFLAVAIAALIFRGA